jgi:hypothetical protein
MTHDFFLYVCVCVCVQRGQSMTVDEALRVLEEQEQGLKKTDSQPSALSQYRTCIHAYMHAHALFELF